MTTIDFTPALIDLKLYKRDDAQLQLQFLDAQDVVIPLNGATVFGQIRNELGDLIGTLALSINEVDDAVVVAIAKEEYTTWKWRKGVYDLQVTFATGDVHTLCKGVITIEGDTSYA